MFQGRREEEVSSRSRTGWSSRNISEDLPGMSNPGLRRSFWKQSGGKELKTRKQLPVSKTGGELKITQDRKRCHYTGSLQDRVKIKEKMKHGLGWRKEIELKRETVSYCCSTRSGNKNKFYILKYVKTAIDRTQTIPRCRICKQNNETISHIVSACPKLAQKEYKERHDNIGGAIQKIWVSVKWEVVWLCSGQCTWKWGLQDAVGF